MQNDDVIWQIINHGFCSFKSKVASERTFCSNPYNVTGLCLRSACPLANSQYATIREEDGVCYLYMKTIERAHSPKNMWEKIRLPANYTKALELISEQLEHFPVYLVHRNKQRLTKIHQMLIRMRKLRLKAKPKLVTINTKIEQREKTREHKALKAADLDRAIEKELLERLKQSTDNEIYNYPERQYTKILNQQRDKYEEDEEVEEEDEEYEGEEVEYEDEEEEEEEDPQAYDIQYVEDFEESDDEGEDMEDIDQLMPKFALPTSSSSFYAKKTSASNKRKGSDLKGILKNKDDVPTTTTTSSSSTSNKDKSNKKRKNNQGKGTRVEIEYEDEPHEVENRQQDVDYNF